MTAIAIPRVTKDQRQALIPRRISDFQTVGGGYDPNNPDERNLITVSAGGKVRAKNGQSQAVLTHRQYLADAGFGVILEGERALLATIAAGLADPVWGIWLGRKACAPTAPVLAGLEASREGALGLLIGSAPLEQFTRQCEAASFSEGHDTILDQAGSFSSHAREFRPRRVVTRRAGQK